jgi:hypothetical protein
VRVTTSVTHDEANKAELNDTLCWVFRPLPSQSKFNGLPTRIKGFSGPVGSGKSAALCFEFIRQSYVNRGRQGLLAAPTYSMLRDATLVSLFGMLEAQDVEFEIRKSDGELDICSPRSTALLRSLEEPERLRGTNLAWFGIDELSYTREEGWLRLEARLRDPRAESLSAFAVWTPQGHDWIYKRFIHAPVNGYGCVRAKPFENHHLLDGTPDYYERLESSYDPRFYKQEVLGEYLNSKADRVYHCFDRVLHVVAHAYDPKKPLMWSLDFNVAPMSSVIAQQNGNQLVIIDETVLDRATTEEACLEFENRYRGHSAGLEIFGDASGKNSHTTGTSDYNIVMGSLYKAGFRNVKVRVPARNPSVLSRVQRVNGLLTNSLGEVRLEMHPQCKELVKDFEQVMFKPESGVIDKLKDAKRTHTSDALGYLVWELYGDKPSFGAINKRLF